MPKIMYTISYAFNIALLIVIIVIMTTEQLFECTCLLSRMLQNLRSCVLLEGFANFLVDPYYDPLSLVMIPYIANRSRWKNFADAWVNLNSLENFCGVLTSLNLIIKEFQCSCTCTIAMHFINRSQVRSFYVYHTKFH